MDESRRERSLLQHWPHRLRRDWVILLLFFMMAALFYGPLLLGVRAFPDGDFTHHFFPFSFYLHQAILEARLPLWNPYTYGGHPFLADVQAAVFYPVSTLILLLTVTATDAAARLYWLQVDAVVHTALAGCFAYLWARDLTGSRWGGVVGGITYALSGFMTGYAPLQLAVLRTAVWLPLLLWCLGRGWQQPKQWRWWLGSIGALGASLLAGHSQSFLYLSYAALVWVILLAVICRANRVAGLAGTAAVVVGAAVLTAGQWLPSVEFVGYSVRAHVDYAFVSGGLALADFWQILLPAVLTQYSPLYVGVVGVVLVIVALYTLFVPANATHVGAATTLLPARSGILFCAVVVVFALLASLGGNGPLFPLLYRTAPGWAWFRGQERAAFLVTMGLSGLAAYGIALLPLLSPQTRRRAGFLAGAVVIAMTYAFGLLWQLPGRTAVAHATYLWVAGVTLLLGLAAVVVLSLPGWSPRRHIWLVGLTFANLLWANAGANQVAGTPASRVQVAPEVSALVAAVEEQPDIATGLPGRVYNEYRAYDDYGMRVQAQDVWGSSPLRVARYAALFDQFPLDRMWRLLGVQHLLTWRRELFGPSTVLAEFPQTTDTTYLHRLPATNPRAWLVTQVMIADDIMALDLLADHQFDLGQTGLLGEENRGFTEISGAAKAEAAVRMMRRSAQSLDVNVTSAQDGLLILAETWLPGWEVVAPLCDGTTCPSHDSQGRPYFVPMRADLTLVGLWLPAGTTQMVIQYRPHSVRVGLWISGVALLLLLVSSLWHWRRKNAGP